MEYILIYFFCRAGIIESSEKEVYIIGKEKKKYMYEMYFIPGIYRYISMKNDTVYFAVFDNEETLQLDKSKDFKIVTEKTAK
jgi:hypothetical protein